MPSGVRRRQAKHNPFRSADLFERASFTIGAEAADVIRVTVQLQNANAQAVGERAAVWGYISTDPEGDNVAATAPSGGIAIGTIGVAMEGIADKLALFITNASGQFNVDLTETGVATFYLILVMPDGSLFPSGAITFA